MTRISYGPSASWTSGDDVNILMGVAVRNCCRHATWGMTANRMSYDAEWAFVAPSQTLPPRRFRPASPRSARPSTPSAGWSDPARPGGGCLTTSHPATPSTTRPGGVSPAASPRRSSTTSASCCGSPTDATSILRPSSWIRGGCNPSAERPRADYDGCKRSNGSEVIMAVDTLGRLLTLRVTPADEQDQTQLAALAR